MQYVCENTKMLRDAVQIRPLGWHVWLRGYHLDCPHRRIANISHLVWISLVCTGRSSSESAAGIFSAARTASLAVCSLPATGPKVTTRTSERDI